MPTNTPSPAPRLAAVDWLRGIVMVLMALDHVDHACNPHHAQGDSAAFGADRALSPPDFLVRWCSHLCAPTFVLLAGVGIALSTAGARRRGAHEATIDRHLVLRGLVIVALEFTLVSHYWRVAEGLPTALLPVFAQVLWAIGAGVALMAALRRLPATWQLVLAAALLVGAEVVRTGTLADPWQVSLPTQLLLTGGVWQAPGAAPDAIPALFSLYPVLAWLPAMLLGHVLGQRIAAGAIAPRRLAVAGVAALALFVLLRGIDGFGNMGLHRRSADALEWLHCSKYPPSITFFAMELGLAALLLAALTGAGAALVRLPEWNPLAALGRVPMFFYLLHLPMIGVLLALGVLPARGEGSAAQSLVGMLLVSLACWPFCLLYGWYKRRFAHAWTRYL